MTKVMNKVETGGIDVDNDTNKPGDMIKVIESVETAGNGANSTAKKRDSMTKVIGSVENADNGAKAVRMVKIKLHKDKRSGRGLYVNVNNHSYFIPRGEVVEVPDYIAKVIENSAAQDEETARLIESLTEGSDF